MTERNIVIPDKLESVLNANKDRNIFIWGAGNQGRGLLRVFERLGVRVRGFIDRSTVLQGSVALGLPVLSPEKFISDYTEASPFVIIASFFFDREITSICVNAGLVEGRDFISYTEIKPFDYAVDISGICNLKCISCPRANSSKAADKAGFMSVETFRLVLDKILNEDPLVGNLQLYQWGEPLLNPHIGEIITYALGRGVQCAVSSNLNDSRNLEDAVKAKPGWFRVSVSGYGRSYELTHTGGSWEKFHANFMKLAELRCLYNPDMKTEVYYHMYKHNGGDELKRIEYLCLSAGFEFHPIYAYLICLDDVLNYLEGGSLPETARKAEEMLALRLDDGMNAAQAEKRLECMSMRCIHVNWNLNVSNCMMFYYPENNIAVIGDCRNTERMLLVQTVHEQGSSSLL